MHVDILGTGLRVVLVHGSIASGLDAWAGSVRSLSGSRSSCLLVSDGNTKMGGRQCEGERYGSPELQRRAIQDAAKRNGVTLSDVEVVEEDVSGAKRPEDRRLEDLIARCERGESDGIIVSNVDRLSRGSLRETAAIYERLDRYGARLIVALEGIDSASPGSELTSTCSP